MSYAYVATSTWDGTILATFSRKHNLASWCQHEAQNGFPMGGWLGLYRVRQPSGHVRAIVTELVLVDGDLIEKAP